MGTASGAILVVRSVKVLLNRAVSVVKTITTTTTIDVSPMNALEPLTCQSLKNVSASLASTDVNTAHHLSFVISVLLGSSSTKAGAIPNVQAPLNPNGKDTTSNSWDKFADLASSLTPTDANAAICILAKNVKKITISTHSAPSKLPKTDSKSSNSASIVALAALLPLNREVEGVSPALTGA